MILMRATTYNVQNAPQNVLHVTVAPMMTATLDQMSTTYSLAQLVVVDQHVPTEIFLMILQTHVCNVHLSANLAMRQAMLTELVEQQIITFNRIAQIIESPHDLQIGTFSHIPIFVKKLVPITTSRKAASEVCAMLAV